MGVTYNYGAGPTYTKIASQTLSGASATVTFSNLPQSYTDLVIVCAAKGASAQSMRMQFNSDTATNYSTTNLFANLFGSPGVDSTRYTSESSIRAGYVQNGLDTTDFLHCTIQIQGYANNTTYKSVLARSAKAINVINGLWRSASAITSVALFPASSANFASGSTFSIYGIAAALKPKATGGDITTDGTYFYHTFRSSGLFQPKQNITADYLVVAGGGGGGGRGGGGGGAGGMRCTVTGTGGSGSLESALSLTGGTTHTVTVGAGGAGGHNIHEPYTQGKIGSDSVFSTITSAGGGTGGGTNGENGGAGGSGGGGGAQSGTGGSASPSGQGFAGGAGNSTPRGGGGGGASATGTSGSSSGNGGAGRATSISGSSVTYAGGGGGGAWDAVSGGTGGTGGGGNGGAASTNGSAATANTGSGGGAGGHNGTGGASNYGGAGGSGIVIVRYSA